jgi:hypothetical protein
VPLKLGGENQVLMHKVCWSKATTTTKWSTVLWTINIGVGCKAKRSDKSVRHIAFALHECNRTKNVLSQTWNGFVGVKNFLISRD